MPTIAWKPLAMAGARRLPTRPASLLVLASLVACAAHVLAASRVDATSALSTRTPPRFVGPGVTVAIDDVAEEAAADEPGVLAVTVTLANSGVPLNVRYRDFALTATADERYPALLPSELGMTARDAVLLREGVLGTGESLSAVLFFRMQPLSSRFFELRVEVADVHDTPIGQGFLPILRAGGRHR
jgi:hypothetical protein